MQHSHTHTLPHNSASSICLVAGSSWVEPETINEQLTWHFYLRIICEIVELSVNTACVCVCAHVLNSPNDNFCVGRITWIRFYFTVWFVLHRNTCLSWHRRVWAARLMNPRPHNDISLTSDLLSVFGATTVNIVWPFGRNDVCQHSALYKSLCRLRRLPCSVSSFFVIYFTWDFCDVTIWLECKCIFKDNWQTGSFIMLINFYWIWLLATINTFTATECFFVCSLRFKLRQILRWIVFVYESSVHSKYFMYNWSYVHCLHYSCCWSGKVNILWVKCKVTAPLCQHIIP